VVTPSKAVEGGEAVRSAILVSLVNALLEAVADVEEERRLAAGVRVPLATGWRPYAECSEPSAGVCRGQQGPGGRR